MPRESEYQKHIIKRLEHYLPDNALILKGDAHRIQGFPDILVLLNDMRWFALEVKNAEDSPHQPNQDYWVERCNEMSFARFIFPENEEEVFDELQRSLFL